jgi:hypothetical protein
LTAPDSDFRPILAPVIVRKNRQLANCAGFDAHSYYSVTAVYDEKQQSIDSSDTDVWE